MKASNSSSVNVNPRFFMITFNSLTTLSLVTSVFVDVPVVLDSNFDVSTVLLLLLPLPLLLLVLVLVVGLPPPLLSPSLAFKFFISVGAKRCNFVIKLFPSSDFTNSFTCSSPKLIPSRLNKFCIIAISWAGVPPLSFISAFVPCDVDVTAFA